MTLADCADYGFAWSFLATTAWRIFPDLAQHLIRKEKESLTFFV